MKKFLAGAISGFVATAPMTATMLLLHHQLRRHESFHLPPEDIADEIARRAGIGRSWSLGQHQATAWISHFCFGAAAGALYAPLAEKVKAPPIAKGAAFGLLVWTTSYLGWLPALKILHQTKDQPARPNWLMVVAHLVWGASLGVLCERLED